MAVLVAQSIVRAGLTPAFASAAGGGDEFVNTGNEYIEVINGDASSKTVTVVTPGTVDGLGITDRTVTIPAGERRKIGPFPTGTYNNASSKVQITYSAVTSVTIGVFSL